MLIIKKLKFLILEFLIKKFFFLKKKTSNVGGYSLTKTGKIKSKIDKLDNLIKLKNEIGLIKIDIEGHELQALIGMKKLITNNNSILMIEFFDEIIKKRKTIVDFVQANGYKHSYFFSKNYKSSKKNYLVLFKNILKVIFFSTKYNSTLISKIDFNTLIESDIKSNVIFSKKKLSLKN